MTVPITSPGLADLFQVTLDAHREQALERVDGTSLGPPAWRAWKKAQVRELLALDQIAPRMQLLGLDPTTELRALVRLAAPVPCLPPGAHQLVIGDRVDFALRHPEETLRSPLPGMAVVEILHPRHVHLSNVGTLAGSQPLCLGTNVPRGFPAREAVLATYAAVTLQSATLDERDPAGVMNLEAAHFWQTHPARIPLTSTPFLAETEAPS